MNPVFNQNKLKLGLFGINGKGTANSLVPEAHRPTWENNVRIAQAADAAGLEAIVSYSRWKGHSPNNLDQPTGVVLDPLVWAAGIAQATARSAIFATTNAHTLHPITAAKQCATIDAISAGRFGLNIVATWFRPELEMFRAPVMDRETRYEHLAEWFEILTRLWSYPDEFDFEGRFFSVKDAGSRPQPIQRPRPPIMNAATSPMGRNFAARHADICFVEIQSLSLAETAEQIAKYKQTSLETYGRSIQVWTIVTIVQRRTEREAEDYVQYYAVENADSETIEAWIKNTLPDAASATPEQLQGLKRHVGAGAGGTLIVGGADHVSVELHKLSSAGIDGVLLSWVNFEDGLTRFVSEVLPRLERDGLRDPIR